MPLFGPHTIRAFDNNHIRLVEMLIQYHDNRHYLSDLRAVADLAARRLKRAMAKKPQRPTLVLDIDETCLASDWASILQVHTRGVAGARYSYYNRKAWNRWVERAEAEPIAPTLDVYRLARQHGWNVFFITGRDESQKLATKRNLRRAGFDHWDEVIMRREGETSLTAASFKLAARWRIAARGYNVLVNIGDQASDLSGDIHGHVAKNIFKLPNPFYFVA